ncbi:MAG: glycosyltransferase [Nonlabens sp.]
MATFNRAHMISQTLDSVLGQTYGNWECLIVDDGSSDETDNVVNDFIERDDRFKYFKRPDTYGKGLPGARNCGLDRATGNYIIFYDDDDIIHPQNLEISLAYLKSASVDFCIYGKGVFVHEQTRPDISFYTDYINMDEVETINLSLQRELLDSTIPMASCTVLWCSSIMNKYRFKEDLHYAEEWELYNRILSEGAEGIKIDKVLYYARKHPNSNSGEYWNNDPIRIQSKKEAILNVYNQLSLKKQLDKRKLAYFIGAVTTFKIDRLKQAILDDDSLEHSLKRYARYKWKSYPLRSFINQTFKKLRS